MYIYICRSIAWSTFPAECDGTFTIKHYAHSDNCDFKDTI